MGISSHDIIKLAVKAVVVPVVGGATFKVFKNGLGSKVKRVSASDINMSEVKDAI